MNKTVLIAGNGKLAQSMVRGLPKYIDNCTVDVWENNEKYPQADKVIVHIGSGRQFDEIIDFCVKTRTPLIQGSTVINACYRDSSFTYIDAPNFNILMLKFMCMMKEFGSCFKDYTTSIVESHQQSKVTLPGTAVEFAQALGVNPEEIQSIRDPDTQESTYEIPHDCLELHAMHDIRISDENTSINLRTLVKGHESYVSGLAVILNCLEKLEPKYYHILDLLEMKLM